MHWLWVLLCLGFPAAAETSSEISIGGGQTVRIVDGDTIEIGGRRVQLKGFVAPEIGRRCADRRGRMYDCGAFAAKKLTEWFRTKPKPRCTVLSDRARNGVRLGRCVKVKLSGHRVPVVPTLKYAGAWMVENGWAMASDNETYLNELAFARARRRGFWESDSPKPWE